ncbi:Mechanosensitive ion channel protein [Citrus sinensis]|uniref:Mechanosensitive ion channel protein n=1 Tax=Citrus sinensis TaxID=2711 RepID=A0ACB8LCR0_CITSI|nr:Mechanosensitive ion channel protein [Citrus sinensis]
MEIGEGLNLVEKKGDYHPNDAVIQIAADTEDAPISKEISESQSGRIDTVITEKEDLIRRKPVLVATGSPDNPLAETAGGQGQSFDSGKFGHNEEKKKQKEKKHKKGGNVKKILTVIELIAFVSLLVASRLSKRFFDQIQEALFDEYVIFTSSGPPLIRLTERVGRTSMENETGNQNEEETIHHVRGKRKKMKKISAWTMEKLINYISSKKLSIVSNELDDYEYDVLGGDQNKNIGSESEAEAAALQIFRNVARPDKIYMEKDDLLRSFIKEDVDEIMRRLGVAETGRVKRSDVKNWVVNVYKQRKSLAHYLNNSKEAMQELNKLFTGIVMVLIIIVWLLIVGLLTTKALLLILSQVVLAVFLFGNIAKNISEAIIFLFVTHPFDVGDRCVIDGAQMVVEEMHIMTTIFLRYDNEKIFYPNSVLATKPISNFYRSAVEDAVEFAIDVFTPMEKILHIKSRIKSYLEFRPQQWSPTHSVEVKHIKDEKMIMGLYITHIELLGEN